MAWFYLFVAGGLEVVATTVFRYTDGLSRIVPTVSFFAIGILSFYFLNRSLQGVPLGTAYAVWTGIGAAGTALLGVALYNEDAAPARVLLLVALVACIVGLKYVSAH
jgi:quaternary ammonium compound-resistance protein SugE